MHQAFRIDLNDFEVRKGWPEDQAFVAKTMAAQLARFTFSNNATRNNAICARSNATVDRILNSTRVRVLVATPKDNGTRIAGFLVYVPTPRVRTIVFAFVRAEHLRAGVCTMMTREAFKHDGVIVHGGLRGYASKEIMKRFASAIEMPLDELI